jgi:acyl carrier protein
MSSPLPPLPDEAEILAWLIENIARETRVAPAEIDPDMSVHALGIDSALVISLTFDLETRFGLPLDPAALFAHPNLRSFARHLANAAQDRAVEPGA